MHHLVKELSPHVIAALKGIGYGCADIEIEPTSTVSSYSGGNDGQRGFVIIVNLDTGARDGKVGSWGGNGLGGTSPVDVDAPIEIPANGVVIKGQTGYPRTFARIYAHPDAFGRMLPSGEPAEALTPAEDQAIYCFAAIKGGEYRREEMARRNVSADTVDGLVSRGYLKRSKNGATQITTKGRNARTVRN